jgi:hypothetical protein
MMVSEESRCAICKNKRQFLVAVYDRNDPKTLVGFHYTPKPICPMCFSMLNKTAMMYARRRRVAV